MNYSEYLFSCLLKIYDSQFERLPYDIQFEQIHERYEEFANSSFNDEKRSEYDCIVSFLNDKYPIYV